MWNLIRRHVVRLFVNAAWRDYLKDGGRLVIYDADDQEYEWLPDIGAWEPTTSEM